MSNVRKWLEAIGLAQYGDIFESCCCLNLLSHDEARRIVANVARLPELLQPIG